MWKHLRDQAGASLAEVLVAIALTGIMLPAFAEAVLTSEASRPSAAQRVQALSLEREAMEAVRVVREQSWTNVATDNTYYLTTSGNTWALTTTPTNPTGFTRQIIISSVQRNSSGAIVASSGTVDPSTKHVVVTVTWTRPIASSVSSDTYLSRWQNNAAWTQTTQADFNAGTLINTGTIASGGVQLLDSPATWQQPSLIGSGNITGNVSGLCVREATVSGTPYAFVGYATGMAIFNVSNPASPTLTGTFATSAAVNGIFVSGTLAYLATAITNAQLKIVNVSNPAAPSQTGTLGVGGNSAANAIFVVGTSAYMVKNSETGGNGEFNIINVSNPAAPTLTGKLARQSANFFSVYVSGTFAYVATAQTSAQFRVINISTPTAPTSAATVNLGVQANSITLNGTTAYIGTNNNASSGELRIYNVSTPSAPTSVGSYEVGGNVNGVSIDLSNPNYIVLATAVTNKQSIAVDISTPASPTLVSNLNLGSTANNVRVVGSYAYVGTVSTSQELMVVYTGYRPSGTFESSTLDGGANVGFNSLSFTIVEPAGTNVTFQIATNSNNATWNYVGTDGTAGTSFSVPGFIWFTNVSARYFRYKATLTSSSNGQSTPQISDVTANYSL